MANTYTQIYIQVVFAVEGRQNLVRREWKEELQKYMTGIVTAQGQKPNIALSDLVGDIKTGSTNFINRQRWVAGRYPLHPEPGATPRAQDVSIGVSGPARQIPGAA